MSDLRAALGVIDRPHPPRRGEPDIASYKEWYHFNVLDTVSGTDLIVNLSVAGDVTRAGGGDADLIVLCHRRGEGWHGGIERFDAAAVGFDARSLRIESGPARIAFENGEYRLQVERTDPPARIDLRFAPRTDPLLLWNDTPLGGGRLNWLIVPHLDASGAIDIGRERIVLDDACAYHDHNWGHWRWGDDFGWEWGFCADERHAAASTRTTLVFDRTSDRQGDVSLEHTLAVWRGATLAKVFTRHALRCRREGRFEGDVRREPGAACLVAPGAVVTVPRGFAVSSRDGADWLDLDYRIDAALQVSVPREYGFGLVGLNETFGEIVVSGEVGGERIAFAARACFEFLG
ncbi:hypothetical protein [Paraburkholderia caballeronis]|uniref:hypothetical protein n=1 Tax=Paraburkholderia caballeronis TaxID=416943 RepID=UPI001064B7B4|nr:hypothetical protein [Paraburkholderia caballeronis]TDV19379.1 hypothetical protein C7408_102122 [Paraburkholderia caballeronis]TDV21979.1 hypothetical protein C7406_101122 [Paraburkholderia caballeronis]TDV28882.1 hypothetical protein C7404_102122 [Paraburkholderia caballeronis]